MSRGQPARIVLKIFLKIYIQKRKKSIGIFAFNAILRPYFSLKQTKTTKFAKFRHSQNVLKNLFYKDNYGVFYTISATSLSIAASDSALSVDFTVTTVSASVTFLSVARISVIFFAAIGAHVPFSTTPTLRLL